MSRRDYRSFDGAVRFPSIRRAIQRQWRQATRRSAAGSAGGHPGMPIQLFDRDLDRRASKFTTAAVSDRGPPRTRRTATSGDLDP